MARSMIAAVVAALVLGAAFSAFAVEPSYREIRISADLGGSTPTGGWKDLVKSDFGIGADLGISLTRSFTTGFSFTYHDSELSDSYVTDPFYDTSGFQWALYTYEVFGEYLLTEQDIAPFVGAQSGVHFTHIDYTDPFRQVQSMGDHGLGFGLSSGLRYRTSKRVGAVLKVCARRTPGLFSGWRIDYHAGMSVFL